MSELYCKIKLLNFQKINGLVQLNYYIYFRQDQLVFLVLFNIDFIIQDKIDVFFMLCVYFGVCVKMMSMDSQVNGMMNSKVDQKFLKWVLFYKGD